MDLLLHKGKRGSPIFWFVFPGWRSALVPRSGPNASRIGYSRHDVVRDELQSSPPLVLLSVKVIATGANFLCSKASPFVSLACFVGPSRWLPLCRLWRRKVCDHWGLLYSCDRRCAAHHAHRNRPRTGSAHCRRHFARDLHPPTDSDLPPQNTMNRRHVHVSTPIGHSEKS